MPELAPGGFMLLFFHGTALARNLSHLGFQAMLFGFAFKMLLHMDHFVFLMPCLPLLVLQHPRDLYYNLQLVALLFHQMLGLLQLGVYFSFFLMCARSFEMVNFIVCVLFSNNLQACFCFCLLGNVLLCFCFCAVLLDASLACFLFHCVLFGFELFVFLLFGFPFCCLFLCRKLLQMLAQACKCRS